MTPTRHFGKHLGKYFGFALALVALTASGCSEDAASGTPDAPVDDVATCKVKGNYAALGALTGTVGANGAGDPTLSITLDPGPPRDVFFFKLVSGAGVFAGGLKAGTFSISGADGGFNTCGLCVNLIADIVAGQGPTKFYQATAGEVTLTSVTAPYTGSVKDLVFGEVTANGTPVPGCASAIASASFSSN
ncbi:MAG: hypothetical protein R3B48_17955 [Kofleriaceae bacterium]